MTCEYLKHHPEYFNIFPFQLEKGGTSSRGSTFDEDKRLGKAFDVLASDRVQTESWDLASERVCTSVYVAMTGWRDGVLIIRIMGRRRGVCARIRADKRARPHRLQSQHCTNVSS